MRSERRRARPRRLLTWARRAHRQRRRALAAGGADPVHGRPRVRRRPSPGSGHGRSRALARDPRPARRARVESLVPGHGPVRRAATEPLREIPPRARRAAAGAAAAFAGLGGADVERNVTALLRERATKSRRSRSSSGFRLSQRCWYPRGRMQPEHAPRPTFSPAGAGGVLIGTVGAAIASAG